jgi:solute carrier family 12 (sodium/potassium/chloride transporter), member 2
VNWGSSAQAQNFKSAINSVQALNVTQDHVKNFRPQILVLSGRPSSRPTLIDLSYLITKNISMLIAGHIIQVRPIKKASNFYFLFGVGIKNYDQLGPLS